MNFENIDTPALLIDLGKMEENIAKMSDLARRNSVALRPHTKTHKSPEIAKLQLKNGAIGITCAKLAEAEVMAAEGLDNILIANEIIGELKYRRLIALAAKIKLCIAVDSDHGASTLNSALQQAGLILDVLIEINCGQNRSGILPGTDVLEFAKRIEAFDNLKLMGLMTHGGHAYNLVSREEIEEVGTNEGHVMVRTAELLRENGIELETISVGSTPTAPYCSAVQGVTEIRPGTYIFNDLTQVELFSCALKNCALSVLATVTSRPASNRAILDAGKKALTSDSAGRTGKNSGFGLIPAKNTVITRLSEEHGVVESEADFTIGEKVKIVPNHACVVVNMFDQMYGIRQGEVERIFQIKGRGKVT